jgi:hypothetical protein
MSRSGKGKEKNRGRFPIPTFRDWIIQIQTSEVCILIIRITTTLKGVNMNKSIFKIMGIMLFLAMSMSCLSCTASKCMIDKQTCNFDCPSTIGLKQVCEEKCNLVYDICRNKNKE